MIKDKEFRGYDVDCKCWRYGYYFCKEDITLYALYNDKEQWKKDKEDNEHHLIIWNGFSDWGLPKPHYQSEVDGKSVGRFTGMYDKNNKSIYEGDIVKFENMGIYPIWWDEDYCGFGSCWFSDFDHISRYKNIEIEVIGNVYENSNLLEDEE